jgi:hypothetical protein
MCTCTKNSVLASREITDRAETGFEHDCHSGLFLRTRNFRNDYEQEIAAESNRVNSAGFGDVGE